MSYQAEISRANPSCFLILLDQSGSMADPFGAGDPKLPKKADAVADVMNRLLYEVIIRCTKAEGVRDYFHVGVIGYGDVEHGVRAGFGGNLGTRELVPISQVADSPLRVEARIRKVPDAAGGLVEENVKFPVWFEPVAGGGTPMCEALRVARDICEKWAKEHPSSYPPTVINITDGEATDGNIWVPGESLSSIATDDGNCLLYNIHLSSVKARPIEFPDSQEGLPDEFAVLLFGMSSFLPEHTRKFAQQEGYRVSERTRGFVFNADMVALIKFLDIGTRPGQLR